MKNISLFIIGIIMLVFAGMFHIYRHGRSNANNPPPPPIPFREKIKSDKQKSLEDSSIPKDQLSYENQTKGKGLINTLFGKGKKSRSSFEKMWNRE